MKALMQDWPLLVHRVLDHAANWHGEREIVSRTVEGPQYPISCRKPMARSRFAPMSLGAAPRVFGLVSGSSGRTARSLRKQSRSSFHGTPKVPGRER